FIRHPLSPSVFHYGSEPCLNALLMMAHFAVQIPVTQGYFVRWHSAQDREKLCCSPGLFVAVDYE
ncbi:hypothetical protein, partial [Pantoea septica]|uniref:hypothetical protein n=1 Tax=Pantoea septica TaxID=472695 RepID=UPI0023F99268